MKLSILPLLTIGAGLLVSASPMRVVVVSSIEESTNVRVGPNASGSVAHLVRPQSSNKKLTNHRGPCRSRFREKSLEISNAFRKALGLPLIETIPKAEGPVSDGMVHILPFMGTPPVAVEVNENGTEGRTQGGDRVKIISAPVRYPHRHHRYGMHRGPGADSSFLNRLHFALMALGPWEGRAVAFVLGCGIGVLLRMFWVLAIVAYRMFKGDRSDSNEYTHIVSEEYPAEAILVAPPIYTYADEKAEIRADVKAPEETK